MRVAHSASFSASTRRRRGREFNASQPISPITISTSRRVFKTLLCVPRKVVRRDKEEGPHHERRLSSTPRKAARLTGRGNAQPASEPEHVANTTRKYTHGREKQKRAAIKPREGQCGGLKSFPPPKKTAQKKRPKPRHAFFSKTHRNNKKKKSRVFLLLLQTTSKCDSIACVSMKATFR